MDAAAIDAKVFSRVVARKEAKFNENEILCNSMQAANTEQAELISKAEPC